MARMKRGRGLRLSAHNLNARKVRARRKPMDNPIPRDVLETEMCFAKGMIKRADGRSGELYTHAYSGEDIQAFFGFTLELMDALQSLVGADTEQILFMERTGRSRDPTTRRALRYQLSVPGGVLFDARRLLGKGT